MYKLASLSAMPRYRHSDYLSLGSTAMARGSSRLLDIITFLKLLFKYDISILSDCASVQYTARLIQSTVRSSAEESLLFTTVLTSEGRWKI
jgi:hypothetical protein